LCSWEQEPYERQTRRPETTRFRVSGAVPAKGCGRKRSGKSSEEGPNSTRDARSTHVLRDRYDEEDPEAVPNGEGGALEASKALLDVLTHSAGEGNLTRAWSAAGNRERPLPRKILSLWKGFERTAKRLHSKG